jgi:cell division transport system ATP-binding protein
MTSIVQMESVGLRYGKAREALCDIDLDLPRGSFHFLLGPSGAGKTSLIRLIHMEERPSRGILRLQGEDCSAIDRNRRARLRRRIGIVFQQARLLADLSVAENIGLPLRIAGESGTAVDQPVAEMLDWIGLAGRAGHYPAELSGGEQQCVAIARAVIAGPDLLLADEPTGDVDRNTADRVIGLFDALNAMGTTVVVATHDLSLLSRVPRAEILHLAAGRLVRAQPAGQSQPVVQAQPMARSA